MANERNSMHPGQMPENPLQAWFDSDPGGWKSYMYPAYIDLGVAANATAQGQIETNFKPFIWNEVAWSFMGNILDPESSGLYNDGMVLVDMKEEETLYFKAPVPINAAFGPHFQGQFNPMPFPTYYPANHSLVFNLTNVYTRVLTPTAETFQVCLLIRGLHYYGEVLPPAGFGLRKEEQRGR